MDDTPLAALLGLGVGLTQTVVRLFVVEGVNTTPFDNVLEVALQSLVLTSLLLAIVPGAAVYGAMRFDAPVDRPVRLAAAVAVGTGAAVALSYPVLSPISQGVPFLEVADPELFVALSVNAVSPAVHSGVGALAGFLLAERRR